MIEMLKNIFPVSLEGGPALPTATYIICALTLATPSHTLQVRIALVRNKVPAHIRDRALIGTMMVALGHAGYVMSQDTSMGAGT
jgi:hypothetical protein